MSNISYEKVPLVAPAVYGKQHPQSFSLTWPTQLALVLVLSTVLISKVFSAARGPENSTHGSRKASPVPYLLPIVGHLISFLRNPLQLSTSISQKFGKSGVVRLHFLTKDVYVVSGAEYLNAVWKNKGMSSCDGLNVALRNMFNTPLKDMSFFKSDRSGISHDPHPQSSRRPEDRVFHLMFKATVDCLTGSHLVTITHKFQAAMERRIKTLPVHEEWVEMDDLFQFLRPLIAYSTIEAICGATFLRRFPDYVESFYTYNDKVPKFLKGWPRFLLPTAWRARERCISILKEWRATHDKQPFDGGEFMLRRWSYFSKMQGLSDYAVACSDLGILWGMFANAMPAGFWLFWHALRDPSLLAAATAEVQACQTIKGDGDKPSLDALQVTNQPLLQSMFAETLRKYVAVYITRQTEFGDAHLLDYQIPKNKMVVINSGMAHMDERNWNLGAGGTEHPVTSFWGQRFLTRGAGIRTSPKSLYEPSESSGIDSGYSSSTDQAEHQPKEQLPTQKFSLDRYKGAWVPFGGGNHQCPGRHWVKTQMLLSLAMITSAFDIELVDAKESLKIDMGKYGLGAMQPAEKVAFRIRRKTASA